MFYISMIESYSTFHNDMINYIQCSALKSYHITYSRSSMKTIYLALVVVLVIVLLYPLWRYLTRSSSPSCDEFIQGVWNADDKYCEDAQISSMLFIVGDANDNNIRPSYLIINNDVCNQYVEVELINTTRTGDIIECDAKITYREDDVWGPQPHFRYNMQSGELRVTGGAMSDTDVERQVASQPNKTLHALLYRNNRMSTRYK